MATTFRHDLRYEASAEAVAAMLADPAFRRAVCERQGVLRHDVGVSTAGGVTTVTIDQVQAADGVPSFAKKFVGDEINIVQVERWSSPTYADVEVTIPGKPGEMSGTATLSSAGGVTTETMQLSIRVGIPFVGGKIEGLVAGLLEKALVAEHEVGVDWLR